MIAVAFILFALLLAGWLMAPGGRVRTPATATASSLQLGEVVA